ncbi:MAG: sugar phosphate isomerase/epimerase family protein [Cyclobacteriaceae bacterium]
MKNKIGFNLLVWSGGIPDSFLPVTERLKTLGYDGIECFMEERDRSVYRKFGDHLRSTGLEATCVLGVGPDENPVSESRAVREKAITRLKEAIDCSEAIGSKIICGPFHSAFATFTNRRPPEDQEYNWSAEVLHAAGEYAAQAKIMLTVEALNRFECYLCNTMDQLSDLVKRAAHPNVKAMFDTHHANIEEKKLSQAIEKISPILNHVHISENDRGTPGDGHIPWDETFSTLVAVKYKGWLTIEAFTRNDPDFANAINVWREYSKPWDMAEQGLKFIQTMGRKHGL